MVYNEVVIKDGPVHAVGRSLGFSMQMMGSWDHWTRIGYMEH